MKRSIPFNDLSIQWRQIAVTLREDIEGIFERSAFSHGPYVEAFEADVAGYLGTKHAIAVNSGTSALHLASLAVGMEPGDEVIVPAHTFIATLWGVLYAGATPVLCDVEPDTGNIDIAAAERCISDRTKAIVPVHLYGQPAEMVGVMHLAARYGLKVIEDTAQAFGGRWRNHALGTIGTIGCFSFYPGKNLGAAGEAGLAVTNDDALAARMRAQRNHGQSERYVHNIVGFNYRMDGIQGVVLRRKLQLIDGWTLARKDLAARYQERLAGLPLKLPVVRHSDHVWHLYVVRTPVRDNLRTYLAEHGIDTGLHYPIPLNKQPCLAGLPSIARSFPEAEKWSSQCLSLPLYIGMTIEDVDYVVATVGAFFRGALV